MTDKKQIIIDGVDVSGCKNRISNKPYDSCNLCTTQESCMFCIDNPNCYYKQLQRTTARHNAAVEQNKELQQELAEVYMKLNAANTAAAGNLALCKDLKEELANYKKALSEISTYSDCVCLLDGDCPPIIIAANALVRGKE